MYKIGIDIGATNIVFALVENLKVLKTQKISCPRSKKEIINVIKKNIKELQANLGVSKIFGIGIGVPGPLSKDRDKILNPPNLKVLKNCSLSKIFEKDLKISTKMENDANCFALAEERIGAGKGAKIVLGITLGSGIGSGIIINGKIFQGAFGSAGEIGHMSIKFDGKKCSCGSNGCFEQYASQKYIKTLSKISPQELVLLAKKGDKKAQKIWKDFGKNLGIGLANIINILDPEIVVIGGGLSNSWDLILEPAKKEIKKCVLSPLSKKNVKIKKAKLGGMAGAIGAALLFDEK